MSLGGLPAIGPFQQGTYAPGSTDNYWMASIAQNASGDIALGYSVSSASTYPSIRYTGRKLGDPLGEMTMGEGVIMNGADSQEGTSRWGDYTMMSVDPSDDETFWYTNEYNDNYTTWGNWITQVASFQFDEYCAATAGCDEYISRVEFGTIDNSTGCDGYSNFVDISNDLPQNVSAVITVTNGNLNYPQDQCGIWVDWNDNGIFTDANETILVSGNPGVGPYTATIMPPPGTFLGEKRMRIRISYNQTPNPCGSTSYGEVEDYTITIASATANVWTGAYNHYWHQAGNWSLGRIPIDADPVEIPDLGYQPVYVDNYPEVPSENCKSLLLESGATLEVWDMSLIVQENAAIYGNVTMDQENAAFTILGDIIWFSGSSLTVNEYLTFINVYGTWDARNGSDLSPGDGFVDFKGGQNGYIRSYDPDNSFYNLRVYKTDGAELGHSAFSDNPLRIDNLLYVSPGANFNSYDSDDIIINGSFNCYGNFDFTGNLNTGNLIFGGTYSGINLYTTGSGLFNNVVFSASVAGSTQSNIQIQGDLTIEDGVFYADGHEIGVAGDWTNSVGPDGFDETDSRVIFNGPGHQYVVGDEHFNVLEVSNGAALRVANVNYDVSCNVYDWTAGGIDIVAGNFTALDLADNGLFGTYWCNPNGTLSLTQDASQYTDLNGELHIFGGTMTVHGGNGSSFWPYQDDALIVMTGGVLDFTDVGIRLNNGYALTEDITGGTIRTVSSFQDFRGDFTPTSGVVELYGATTATLELNNGSTLHNVVINKTAKDGTAKSSTGPVYDPRSGEMISDGSRATLVNLNSDVSITNNLTIEAGSFDLNGHVLDVGHNVIVNNGILVMEDPVDVMNVGNEVIWNSGSSELVSEGTINLDYRMVFYDGSNVQLGANNVLNLLGSSTAIRNYSPLAEIGNLNINMPTPTNVCYISYTTTHPVHVVGNMNVEEDNLLQIQEYDLIVDGVSDIKADATVNLGSSAGDGYFESNGELILNGTLNVDFDESKNNTSTAKGSEDSDLAPGAISPGDNTDWIPGEVFAHGEFSLESGGTLNILGGGSFIWDTPYISGIVPIYGTLNLDDGLFEASHRNISMSGTFNINGGTIRAGRTLIATTAANFQPTGGLVEFVGTSLGSYILISDGNYFNNVRIDRTASILLHTPTILDIKGDLTIDGGGLNSNDLPIYIGGDWMNNVGPDAFSEGIGIVTFNGTGGQECSTEDFYSLQLNKPAGDLQLFYGQTVTCQSYQWLDGEIHVFSGTFTANDLFDNGIYGKYFVSGADATINLHQDDAQFIDLNGRIRIDNGEINVYGGSDLSYWPFDDNAELLLYGGILDFVDRGIVINQSISYSLTTDITGGIIRTSGSFFGPGDGFTPAGGSVLLYGENTALAGLENASHYHHLVINKSEPLGNSITSTTYTDRNGKVIENTRAALVNSNYDFTVEGSLYVNQGTFSTNNKAIQVNEDVTVAMGGTLNIDEGSGILLSGSSTLEVNNGGLVEVLGIEGNPATVSHSAGYYTFDVNSGGMISANYGIFEYMGTLFGIRVRDGGVVDLSNSFDNCQFKNGNAGLSNGVLLAINNNQTLTINNASFPTSGTDYNVGKALDQGYVTFMDYSGSFSGEDYDLDPNNLIEWYTPTLEVLPLVRNVSAAAGTTTFNIISNLDWTVAESVPWLSVGPMSGSGDATLTVNYDENTLFTPFTGMLTISAVGVDDVVVYVVQEAASPELTVTPSIRNVSSSAGSTTFTIGSNTSWTVSESVGWFTVTPMSGSGDALLTVNYDENTLLTPFYGEITVSAFGVPDVIVAVSQEAATPELTVTPASRSVLAPAGSTTFSVGSNTAWTVSESVGWFIVAPMSGSGNGTLTVNYDQNTSVTPRSGQITLSAAGAADVLVTVNQAGAGATLTVTPTNRNVTPVAGSTTFGITSNTSWEVSGSVAWLSALPLSGTGNAVLNVNYGENATGSSRVGSITVTATGGSPSQTVTVTQESYPTHHVSLPEGWSGLSSYIMPAENTITDLMAPLSPNFIILSTMDGVFYPDGAINTIGTWDSQSAYKIKLSSASTLDIVGNEETNKTFDLDAGWSLMPVISNTPVDAASLFAGTDLKIAKDVAGVGMLWPEFGINTLGVFVPGRTYTVRMNTSDAVTFPPNVKNAGYFEIPEATWPSNPWNEIHNGPSTHSIAIIASGISGAMPGDVIGIFDESGQCFGMAEIANIKDNAALNAFADDPYTYDKDGFEVNDPMNIKLFRPATSEVYPTEIVWDDRQPNSSFFENEGVSVISGFKVSTVGINEGLASAISIRPNPSDGMVEISGIEKFNHIEIFNSAGEMIMTQNNNENILKLNLSDLPSGIYQVKFTGVESSVIKKLIRK